jgi:hypothetical protein
VKGIDGALDGAALVGLNEGASDIEGVAVLPIVGATEGIEDEGVNVGALVGILVGVLVGALVGILVGIILGFKVGRIVGLTVAAVTSI